MSSGLQNKMYNYEVAPPQGVWEKIAAELDESELSYKFSAKLQNARVTPPPHIWQTIAVTLDESDLVNDYSSRLHGIEAVPPAGVWNKIKTTLDTEHEAAVPERRRLSPLLHYAAAAAIIGVIAFGAFQLFTGKKNETDVVKITEPAKDLIAPVINEMNAPTDNNIPVTEEARDQAALEASKQTYAKLDVSVTNRIKKQTVNFFSQAVDLTNAFTELTPQNTYREMHSSETNEPALAHYDKKEGLNSRYIMLMTPDGNIIRMSKKLGGILCCVSGEEQDEGCKDQLKKWREKIAGSPSSSSGSFLDVLNMVSSLQENHQL
jgi:hypothetical protein